MRVRIHPGARDLCAHPVTELGGRNAASAGTRDGYDEPTNAPDPT
jgi:hypothetical protein